MGTIRNLQELAIWQMARSFSCSINKVVKGNRFGTELGIKWQMSNAAGSVTDNIAEGYGRGGKNEFVHHLSIAIGSLEEVRSQLFRCHDNGLLEEVVFEALLQESELLLKRISALSGYLNRASIKGVKFKNRNQI